jgi:hypothetical protein
MSDSGSCDNSGYEVASAGCLQQINLCGLNPVNSRPLAVYADVLCLSETIT